MSAPGDGSADLRRHDATVPTVPESTKSLPRPEADRPRLLAPACGSGRPSPRQFAYVGGELADRNSGGLRQRLQPVHDPDAPEDTDDGSSDGCEGVTRPAWPSSRGAPGHGEVSDGWETSRADPVCEHWRRARRSRRPW